MFGFGKKKKQQEVDHVWQQPKKKKGGLEKLVMGAIVGAAVGSIIGASMLPKKAKNDRKIIEGKSKKIEHDTEVDSNEKMIDQPENPKESPRKGRFLAKLKEKLHHSKNNKQPVNKENGEVEDIFKKIPNEQA